VFFRCPGVFSVLASRSSAINSLPPNKSIYLFPRGEILATAVDVRNMWLHTVYADHSLLITDVVDFAEPHTHSCSRFHNSCVWDVKVGENDYSLGPLQKRLNFSCDSYKCSTSCFLTFFRTAVLNLGSSHPLWVRDGIRSGFVGRTGSTLIGAKNFNSAPTITSFTRLIRETSNGREMKAF